MRGALKKNISKTLRLVSALSLPAVFLIGWTATAQISVLTQHYDIGRTGANTSETILAANNVNTAQFGKLFSHSVDGYVNAQPLYISQLPMGQKTAQPNTTHNVVFIGTEHDSVYAFDADNNTSQNAAPLWQITLLDAAHGALPNARAVLASDIRNETDIVPEIGITGTPVIDPSTGTLYVVGKTREIRNNFVAYFQRLHALSIADGSEKFGGPVELSGSVPGTGEASYSGAVHFDPYWQNQRAGLLLLNGIVYIGFGAHEDMDPWHGWILAYNATTLRQTGIWCSTPNGSRGGIWGAGTGLAADVPPGHPYGRLFTSTGNGTFDALTSANKMNFGDSVFRLDLNNGAPNIVPNATNDFTPFDQALSEKNDHDQGSGGTIIVPDSATPGQHLLVQAGKTGRIYVINRENMGGYHPSAGIDPEQKAVVRPVYSAPAYWNGSIYYWASRDFLRAFSFVNGVLSTRPTTAPDYSDFPGSTPVVSANGNDNTTGIVWNVLTSNFATKGNETLQAHDAGNVTKRLYSSDDNLSRDNPGPAVKFVVPTVANGKVYVGAEYQVSVYGLLKAPTQVAPPAISPASQSFTSSVSVTMSDTTPHSAIHYTTDGSTPTSGSPSYTGAISVTTSETIRAIAVASGQLDSNVSSATYTKATQAAMPTFNPAPGTYTGYQYVSMSTSTPGATIYYTTNGATPDTSSPQYRGAIIVHVSSMLKAFATAPNMSPSAVSSAVYTIQ